MYTVFMIRPDGRRYSFQTPLASHPKRGDIFAILGGYWGVVLRVRGSKVIAVEKAVLP